mmetsp:Transcript_47386/g.119997  ORF Transcript_47386/g.119997 Transcript_47386/m.119997 type:complete len:224 (-) Transcript_47386:237-908(-)
MRCLGVAEAGGAAAAVIRADEHAGHGRSQASLWSFAWSGRMACLVRRLSACLAEGPAPGRRRRVCGDRLAGVRVGTGEQAYAGPFCCCGCGGCQLDLAQGRAFRHGGRTEPWFAEIQPPHLLRAGGFGQGGRVGGRPARHLLARLEAPRLQARRALLWREHGENGPAVGQEQIRHRHGGGPLLWCWHRAGGGQRTRLACRRPGCLSKGGEAGQGPRWRSAAGC